jgi:single-strand DNA-binding protein
MYSRIIVMGRVTQPIELIRTKEGHSIANIQVAYNRYWKGEIIPNYIKVVAFGKTAENADTYLAKGSKLLVEGELAQEAWVDRHGQKRITHHIIAEKIIFIENKSKRKFPAGSKEAKEQAQATAQPDVSDGVPDIPEEVPDISPDEIPF